MANRVFGLGPASALAGLAVLSLIGGGLTTARAEDAHSSPEDRARFVSITRQMQERPLDEGLRDDRTWALKWLTDAPDVTANVCTESIKGLLNSHYAYAPEVVVQYTYGLAAFDIEHPEAANDPLAEQSAGVEAAFDAYRSILRDKPDAKSPDVESLLKLQAQGKLQDFLRKALERCAKSGRH